MNWIWCTSTTLSGLIIIINPLVLGHESVNAWIVEESRKEKDVDDIIDTERARIILLYTIHVMYVNHKNKVILLLLLMLYYPSGIEPQ